MVMNEVDVEKFFRDKFKGTPLFIKRVEDHSIEEENDHILIELEFKVLHPGVKWEQQGYCNFIQKAGLNKADLNVWYQEILRSYNQAVKDIVCK